MNSAPFWLVLRAPKILAEAELKTPYSEKNRHAPGAPLRTPRGTPAESEALKVGVT